MDKEEREQVREIVEQVGTCIANLISHANGEVRGIVNVQQSFRRLGGLIFDWAEGSK